MEDAEAKRRIEAAGLDSADEWLLMYIAGLAPRTIADTCRVHPNAVHNRLRRFTNAAPELKDLHRRQAPAEAQSARRPLKDSWIRRLEEVVIYRSETGYLPHPGLPDASHARLGRWLSAQRRQFRAGTLDPAKVAMLDHLRTWRRGFRETLEHSRWRLRLEQLEQFYKDAGRLPSYRADDTHERMLGIWLHGRRIQANHGALDEVQLESLGRAVPGWRGRQTAKRQLTSLSGD